jgi:hypothetical protein
LGRIGGIYNEASVPPNGINFKMKRRSPDTGITVQRDLGEGAGAYRHRLRRHSRQG